MFAILVHSVPRTPDLVLATLEALKLDNTVFKQKLEPLLAHCNEGSDRVVLDFSGVEYISSVGLRVLMLAAKQVKLQKGTIVIAGMQPVVKEIFDISRFNYVFAAFPALRDAVADLSTQAVALLDKP